MTKSIGVDTSPKPGVRTCPSCGDKPARSDAFSYAFMSKSGTFKCVRCLTWLELTIKWQTALIALVVWLAFAAAIAGSIIATISFFFHNFTHMPVIIPLAIALATFTILRPIWRLASFYLSGYKVARYQEDDAHI